MSKKILIIAEAGVNHNGDISLAKEMIDTAAFCGADFVKFQTFAAKRQVTNTASKAEYQRANTSNSETQLQMLSRLELSDNMHHQLIDHCKKANVKF